MEKNHKFAKMMMHFISNMKVIKYVGLYFEAIDEQLMNEFSNVLLAIANTINHLHITTSRYCDEKLTHYSSIKSMSSSNYV